MSNEIFVVAADMPSTPSTPPIQGLVTQTSISVTLNPLPESMNGGSEVTGYIVECDDGLGGSYEIVHDSLNLELIISGLHSSRFYRIRYAARNIVYDSANLFECDQLQWSSSLLVLTAVEPSVPRALKHETSLRYRDALVYSWDKPLTDGGSSLEEYTLEIREVESDVWHLHTLSVQASSYTFSRFDPLSDTKLVPATDYAVRIKVRNIIGESDWTEPVVARTGIEPTRPGLFTFAASTRTTLDLEWTKLTGADTGGSDSDPLEVTAYHIWRDDGLGGPFQLLASLSFAENEDCQYRAEFLKAGLEYRFQLQVENSIGLLSGKSTIQTMRAGTLPSAPG
jgi:hypothetical protein